MTGDVTLTSRAAVMCRRVSVEAIYRLADDLRMSGNGLVVRFGTVMMGIRRLPRRIDHTAVLVLHSRAHFYDGVMTPSWNEGRVASPYKVESDKIK